MGDNLEQLFGGGIETVYWDGHAFKYVEDVTYIFLCVQKEGDHFLFRPNRRVLKVHYEDELFYIMVVRTNEQGDSEKAIHITLPLWKGCSHGR